MQLPEPAATWHHKPEPVFLEVAEVSTCPGGAMNHLELADLLIVGLVASRPVSPPLFPLVLGKKILTKRATKRTSLKWCGFHLSSVGVSLFMPKKSLPVHLALCASGSDFTVTRSDSRIQGIVKKRRNIPFDIFLGIWSWTADSSRAWCPGLCVGRGIWERVCAFWMGRSCYNIGLCCGERWSPAVARYSTALHLQ